MNTNQLVIFLCGVCLVCASLIYFFSDSNQEDVIGPSSELVSLGNLNLDNILSDTSSIERISSDDMSFIVSQIRLGWEGISSQFSNGSVEIPLLNGEKIKISQKPDEEGLMWLHIRKSELYTVAAQHSSFWLILPQDGYLMLEGTHSQVWVSLLDGETVIYDKYGWTSPPINIE